MISLNFFAGHRFMPGLFVLALIFLLGLNSHSFAETSEHNNQGKYQVMIEHYKNEPDYKSSSPAKEASGFQVYIDPDTGEFVEPAIGIETEVESAVPNGAEVTDYSETATEEPAPGGGVMLVKPGGFVHFSTARIKADGSISINCGN